MTPTRAQEMQGPWAPTRAQSPTAEEGQEGGARPTSHGGVRSSRLARPCQLEREGKAQSGPSGPHPLGLLFRV